MRRHLLCLLLAGTVFSVGSTTVTAQLGNRQAPSNREQIENRNEQRRLERQERLEQRRQERLDRRDDRPAGSNRDELENLTRSVNQKARGAEQMDLAIKRISTQTGVPAEDVRQLHRRFSDEGAGSLLLACVMAAETKKQPEHFLQQHQSGKSWAAIARDNNIPAEKLTVRLERVEDDLTPTARGSNRRNRD